MRVYDCINFIKLYNFLVGIKNIKIKKGEQMSIKNESNTFSIISIVLGGLAFILLPPFFGGAGVILAIIGKTKNEKMWGIGLAVSIVGAVVGMIFGAYIALLFS